MPVSMSAALAIKDAAVAALSSTPASYLQPYLPKGPVQARSAGAIAWMKQSGKMADLLILCNICSTLEALLLDPKGLQAMVDQANALRQVGNANPLDEAQADYRNAETNAYLNAVAGAAKQKMNKELDLAKVTDPALAKMAGEARKESKQAAFQDLIQKGIEDGVLKKRPGVKSANAPSAENPTTFGHGYKS